jgi:hypothetical protein
LELSIPCARGIKGMTDNMSRGHADVLARQRMTDEFVGARNAGIRQKQM